MYAAYARTQDVRALASVIGEEELSDVDQKYLKFGRAFEREFVNQSFTENRTIMGLWRSAGNYYPCCRRRSLPCVTLDEIAQYYKGDDAAN